MARSTCFNPLRFGSALKRNLGKGLGFPLHGVGGQQRQQGETLAPLRFPSLAGQQGDGQQQGVAMAAMLHGGGHTAMISNSDGPRKSGEWGAVLGNLLLFSSWVGKVIE